jgi:hypothetical protein
MHLSPYHLLYLAKSSYGTKYTKIFLNFSILANQICKDFNYFVHYLKSMQATMTPLSANLFLRRDPHVLYLKSFKYKESKLFEACFLLFLDLRFIYHKISFDLPNNTSTTGYKISQLD